MFPRRMVMVVLIGLVIFGLISTGNSAGYSQGYQMGYMAAGGEAGAMAPPAVTGYGFFTPFALLFGFIFKIGFFFLILMFFGKAFHALRWRMTGGSGHHWDHQDWEKHKAKWAEWKKSWASDHHRSPKADDVKASAGDIDRSDMI